MAKNTKYGLRDLRKNFPTDEKCLEFIYDNLHDRLCECGGRYSLLKGRRKFQCSRCRYQIAPTAGTIFHKSDTPLTLWFHALWVFSNAESGISAKEMERQLAVTYKTAWRILRLIRESLGQDTTKLRGDVEMDSAYFGGKAYGREPLANKSVMMAAIERGGEVRIEVTKDGSAKTHGDFLRRHIEPVGTRLMTDKTNKLQKVAMGYNRHMVDHHRKEYVRGDVYTNTMESFFAHVKRSIRGTHKVVSKQHLQNYLNAFAFQWNNARNDRRRFSVLLGTVLLASRFQES